MLTFVGAVAVMDGGVGRAKDDPFRVIHRPNLSTTQECPFPDRAFDTSSRSIPTIPARRSFPKGEAVPEADTEELAGSGKRDPQGRRNPRRPRSASWKIPPSFPIFNEDENDEDYVASKSHSRRSAMGTARDGSSDEGKEADDLGFDEAHPLLRVPGENRNYNTTYGKFS